jgi:hypothetical protein
VKSIGSSQELRLEICSKLQAAVFRNRESEDRLTGPRAPFGNCSSSPCNSVHFLPDAGKTTQGSCGWKRSQRPPVRALQFDWRGGGVVRLHGVSFVGAGACAGIFRSGQPVLAPGNAWNLCCGLFGAPDRGRVFWSARRSPGAKARANGFRSAHGSGKADRRFVADLCYGRVFRACGVLVGADNFRCLARRRVYRHLCHAF